MQLLAGFSDWVFARQEALPDRWDCSMNTWDRVLAHCRAAEDLRAAADEMASEVSLYSRLVSSSPPSPLHRVFPSAPRLACLNCQAPVPHRDSLPHRDLGDVVGLGLW